MTPIYRERIDHPMAWRGSDIRSKDEISFDLSARHVAALKDVLHRVNGMALEDIRREHCGHPALDADMARIFDEVQNGRGMMFLRGIPVADHPLPEIEKMYWALDTHLGTALSQNCLGHCITYVQEELLPGGVQATRGHKSRQDLAMHTDNAEIFTLLCVRKAREGGQTQFTSALAVHNDLLANRPEVLPVLYRGFPYHRRGDQPDDHPMVTPYDMPVLSNVDGHISVCLIIGSIMAGLHERGRSLTDEEQAALDAFHEATMRLQFEQRYEPGEMSVVNNLTIVHSRSEYRDWDEPEKRRLLLRIWLEAARDRRPVVREMSLYENKHHLFGCDPVPGRSHARNDYAAVPESLLNIIKEGQKKQLRRPNAN